MFHKIKYLFTLLTLCLFSYGQKSNFITHKGVALDSLGQIIQNKPIKINVTLFSDSINGNIEYKEFHSYKTNENGTFNIKIGKGNLISGNYDQIKWQQKPKFLKIETALANSNSFKLVDTTQLSFVPYSIYSEVAMSLTTPIVTTQGVNIGDMLFWNGTQWVNISASTAQNGQNLVFCNGKPNWGGCPPLVATTGITNVATNLVTLSGQVLNSNGSLITKFGILIDTVSSPEINRSKVFESQSYPNFKLPIYGLKSGITYYARAFATNNVGTSYGEVIPFSQIDLKIGQELWGGKVAYLLQEGDQNYMEGHTQGLIVSHEDLSPGIAWYNHNYALTGASSTVLGSGMENTLKIISIQGNSHGSNYAANLCRNYHGGGFKDWFLPTLGEMEKIYLNRSHLDDLNTMKAYWTSCESSYVYANYILFKFNGPHYFNLKYNKYAVRAVRTF